jgi:hypothetical protein
MNSDGRGFIWYIPAENYFRLYNTVIPISLAFFAYLGIVVNGIQQW